VDITIPKHAEPGTWVVNAVWMRDGVGNYDMPYTAELAGAGLPTEFTVIDPDPDMDVAQLPELSFAPTSVDVSAGAQDVTFTMRITDNLSGLRYCGVTLASPTTLHRVNAWLPLAAITSPLDDTYSLAVTIPQHVEPGTWDVEAIWLRDVVGNWVWKNTTTLAAEGHPTQLTVIDPAPDSAAPVLEELTLTDTAVNCSLGAQSVAVDLRISDTLSGFRYCLVTMVSPSGKQTVYRWVWVGSRTSGTPLDGTYTAVLDFPACSEEGCWTIRSISLRDEVGNARSLSTAQLTGAGFDVMVCNGFVAGAPRARIKAPKAGRRVSGQRVTIVAELVSGEPSDVQKATFQYRAPGSSVWLDVPAANLNHPNPDLGHPYFVHWDVSALAAGTYDLRVVAMDTVGAVDPSPETLSVVVDPVQPDLVEGLDGFGREVQRARVDVAADTTIVSAAEDQERLGSVTLPAGASNANDWLSVTSLAPGEFTSGLVAAKHVVGGLEVDFDSGQSMLANHQKADILISYADADDDGIVDGTTIPETDLVLYHYDPVDDKFERLEDQAIATGNNLVRARTHHFSSFVLVEQLSKGTLTGTITDQGTALPVQGATVTTNTGGFTGVTDAAGAYSIAAVEVGTYRLTVSASGYLAKTSLDATVLSAQATSTDMALESGAITGVTPNSGSESGGTSFTIDGSGFASGATVSLSGTYATSVVVVSATQITAVSPAGSGPADVVVKNPDGQSATLESGFSYTAPPAASPSPSPSPSPAPAPSDPISGGVILGDNAGGGGGGGSGGGSSGGGGGGCQLAPASPGEGSTLLLLLLVVLGLRSANERSPDALA
jgi:hypothetical protein